MKKLYPILVLFVFALNSNAQIVVVPAREETNPISDSIVKPLAGFGISISNVQSNLKPTNQALASFRSDFENFPIRKGVMMCTGEADTIPGANSSGVLSVPIPVVDTVDGVSEGRQMLNILLKNRNSPTQSLRTTDVATIRFDLVPAADSIRFRYIFASEEYPQFVCSNFNDVFGFFIQGPGIEGDSMFQGTPFQGFRNLAIIPGTDLPVSINTVNSGTAGQSGIESNCTFTPEGINQFIRNSVAGDPFYHVIKLNGLTKLMEARTKVQACQTYRMILAIGDAMDRAFDSSVFLEKGSLESGEYFQTSLVTSPLLLDTLTACQPGRVVIRRCPQSSGERWVIPILKTGSALAGIDFLHRLPNGTLGPVPDSLVLGTGEVEDSLVFQAIGNQFTTKDLTLRFLDVQKPYINGQPNFAGKPLRMLIRPLPTVPASPIQPCAYDSAQVRFLGPDLPGMRYRWKEWTQGVGSDPEFLNCDTCRSPTLYSDTVSRLYRVSISNSFCSYQDSLRVQPKPFVRPTFEQGPGWFLLTNPQAQYQYQWTINQQPVASDPTDTLWYNSGDSLLFSAQALNGCSMVFDSTALFTSTDRTTEISSWEIRIYPNPASESTTVTAPGGPAEIRVFSTNGQLWYQGKSPKGKIRIDLKGLPDGLYWVESRTSETGIKRKKLIKLSR